MYGLAIAIGVVALYLAAVGIVNRRTVPQAKSIQVMRTTAVPTTGRSLRVLTWNLGYAGLGATSDFVADGGRRIRAASPHIVDQNLAGIIRTLGATPADVYALQECSITSPLNHWRPVWAAIKASVPSGETVWQSDVISKLIPWPLRLNHGTAILANVKIASASSVPLPLEPKYWLGLMRKQYALLVTRYSVEGAASQWVIANMHLAAFDDGGATRREQLNAVMRFAQAEFERGNWVIVAGDWNMVLGGRQFPHQTAERFLGWVHPMPSGALPPGWEMVFDSDTPSVRTLHQAYVPGQNFVTIIDGFLISPNVAATSVKTFDLGFEYSDHQPVLASFVAK